MDRSLCRSTLLSHFPHSTPRGQRLLQPGNASGRAASSSAAGWAVADHAADNAKVFGLELDDEDRSRIEAVTRKGRNLFQRIGDCGDEYRG